jgi:hypothetical protein
MFSKVIDFLIIGEIGRDEDDEMDEEFPEEGVEGEREDILDM